MPKTSPRAGERGASVVRRREPEVEQRRLAAGADHQVRGFDVAVHDAGFVRGVERPRRLFEKREQRVDARAVRLRARGPRLAPFAREAGRQRLAGDEPHRDVRRAARDARVVDGADRRMVDARRRGGLAPEAAQHRLGAGAEVGVDLQGDGASEAGILGLVDGRLPAAADLAAEQVGAEARRGGRVRRRAFRGRFEAPQLRQHRGGDLLRELGASRDVPREVGALPAADLVGQLLIKSEEPPGVGRSRGGVGRRGVHRGEGAHYAVDRATDRRSVGTIARRRGIGRAGLDAPRIP